MVNQALLELHMKGNSFGDDGITAIAGSLSYSSITVLNVQGCNITLTGVRLLAAALSINRNIRELWLFNNPITIDGAHSIMKSAVYNRVCQDILIDGQYYDDEVTEMKNTLNNRRKQDVRIYVITIIIIVMLTEK